MRDAGHRTPDGEKSKNNISTPQGGGHNKTRALTECTHLILLTSEMIKKSVPGSKRSSESSSQSNHLCPMALLTFPGKFIKICL